MSIASVIEDWKAGWRLTKSIESALANTQAQWSVKHPSALIALRETRSRLQHLDQALAVAEMQMSEGFAPEKKGERHCPIGLDNIRGICSVASCIACRAHRADVRSEASRIIKECLHDCTQWDPECPHARKALNQLSRESASNMENVDE